MPREPEVTRGPEPFGAARSCAAGGAAHATLCALACRLGGPGRTSSLSLVSGLWGVTGPGLQFPVKSKCRHGHRALSTGPAYAQGRPGLRALALVFLTVSVGLDKDVRVLRFTARTGQLT